MTTTETTTEAAVATRWVGVGRSADDDAFAAGAAAATGAVQHDDAGLLVVFCWDGYDHRALLAGIRSVAPETPLIGCSTAGEISAAGPVDASVVVTALGGPGFRVATRAANAAELGLREASAQAAQCARQLGDGEHKVLLLLNDGLGGDMEEIVRGAYSEVGAALPLVGGCAGDGLRMEQTVQLHGHEVTRHSVVAAAIASDAPFGIGVSHGWTRVGQPLLVTASEDNCVLELDDQPALDVYLERLDAPEEAGHDAAAFTRFATTHPLGLQRRSGEQVRCVNEADFTDRSLICAGQVPTGGLTWAMEGDEASVLEASASACHEALTSLEGHPPLGLLAFDCIGRRGILGEQGIHREVERITEIAGGAPVAGFYTYGEIARTHGQSGLHNQTLVVLAVG
jgi:hypothetical protein